MKVEQQTSQKITPFLWFDNQAEEAAKFYTSVFRNSRINSISPMVVTFQIEGMDFMALNGGPMYKFTPAISFMVHCDTQAEIDELWEKLTSNGGQEVECGWLTDKYGLSWQIIPVVFGKMMGDKDPAKVKRTMDAMMQMKKMDIQKLQEAFDGEEAVV
jgi:predicted 3-demethylubiquinone-9 3-methyltransferase (glyoxalase superfamily)